MIGYLILAALLLGLHRFTVLGLDRTPDALACGGEACRTDAGQALRHAERLAGSQVQPPQLVLGRIPAERGGRRDIPAAFGDPCSIHVRRPGGEPNHATGDRDQPQHPYGGFGAVDVGCLDAEQVGGLFAECGDREDEGEASEGEPDAPLLAGLTPGAAERVRGREESVDVWML